MANKSQWISVEADVAEVQKALSGTKKSLSSIQKQTIAVIAKGTIKAIKGAIPSSGLQRRTGELLKCFGYRVKKDGSEGNVYPRAIGASGNKIFPKVFSLNYGNRKWHGYKPKGFIQSGERFIENGDYEAEVNKLVQKTLDRYWK